MAEPCQTSNASMKSELNSINTEAIYFSDLTGDDPWASFSPAFNDGHLPGGIAANRYLLIGTIEKEGGDNSPSDAIIHVRKWYVISPVKHAFVIGLPWYLNRFDLK